MRDFNCILPLFFAGISAFPTTPNTKIINYFKLRVKWKIVEFTIQFFGYL